MHGGVKSELSMPDTSKRDEPVRLPGQQENLPMHKIDPSALQKLFDEWMHGDETEQRETFEELRRKLDEGRPAGYKFFP